MGISWKQFFDLIQKRFEENQKGIGDYLDVHRSVISRLKNGKQQTKLLTKNKLYGKLFDLENTDSLAYKHGPHDPKDALEVLKECIKEKDLTDAVNMLDENDYKKFVMGLLDLIERGQPNKPMKKTIILSNELEHNISQNDEKSESNCSVISIPIPPECRICLCCENWKGNMKNAYESVNGVEGKCIMFDKNTLSSDGGNCKRFNASYSRISIHQKSIYFKKMYKGTFR